MTSATKSWTMGMTGSNSVVDETYDPFMFIDAKLAKEYIRSKVKKSATDEIEKEIGENEIRAEWESTVMGESSADTSLTDRQRLFMKTDCVNEASGSSLVEIGNSKVLCSLYGPREVPRKDDNDFKIANLNVEFRFASFSCFMQRRGTLSQRDQTLDERHFSAILEKTLKSSILLHKYPKSQIDIYLLCIQNDFDSKNILTACTIAGSLALSNASIELYDLVASYTSTSTNLTVAYMPAVHQISNIYFENEQQRQDDKLDDDKTTNKKSEVEQDLPISKSSISCDFFKSQVKECVENCKKVYAFMQMCILKSTNDSHCSTSTSDVKIE